MSPLFETPKGYRLLEIGEQSQDGDLWNGSVNGSLYLEDWHEFQLATHPVLRTKRNAIIRVII